MKFENKYYLLFYRMKYRFFNLFKSKKSIERKRREAIESIKPFMVVSNHVIKNIQEFLKYLDERLQKTLNNGRL